jgi:hypothetical protein
MAPMIPRGVIRAGLLPGFLHMHFAAIVLITVSSTVNAALVDRQPALVDAFGFCTFSTSCKGGVDHPYGAENFSLSSTASIRDISVYVAIDNLSSDPDRLHGIDWILMQDNGGSPDIVISQAFSAGYTASFIGAAVAPNGTTSHWHYRYDIDTPDIDIGPGQYWLAFRLLDSKSHAGTDDRFYWARYQSANADNFQGSPLTGWTSPYATENEFAFAINLVVPDADGDGVPDDSDNCITVANGPNDALTAGPSQNDTDNDGYGNMCDPDLNNDGVVDFGDLPGFQAAFLSSPGDGNWNEDADLNGDDVVDFGDLPIIQSLFFGPPGPSCCPVP